MQIQTVTEIVTSNSYSIIDHLAVFGIINQDDLEFPSGPIFYIGVGYLHNN